MPRLLLLFLPLHLLLEPLRRDVLLLLLLLELPALQPPLLAAVAVVQRERRPIRRRKRLELVELVALVAVAPLRARGAALQLHSLRGAVRGARACAALVHGAVRLRAPDDLALRDASVARFSSGRKKTPSEPGNHADYGKPR